MYAKMGRDIVIMICRERLDGAMRRSSWMRVTGGATGVEGKNGMEGACAGLWWYSNKQRSAGINSGRMNFRCGVYEAV